MARTETWFDQDLKKPVSVRIMAGVQFSEDNQGSLIGVRVYDDGADATLTGGATGYCILADGQTITVDGTREGNTAYILLPQSALLVPGPIQITIKLVDDGVITTLLACVGTVIRTKIGVPVVPGSVIEEWSEQISETLQECVDECQAAADAMGANLATTYSSSATYPVGSYVIQSGTLYRCTTAVTTAGSWSTNSGKFTAVKLGNDVADLKSAIDHTGGVPVVNQTVSGTKNEGFTGLNVPAGKYVFECDSIVTSGTDKNKSCIYFYDTNSEISLILTLDRNVPVKEFFELPSNATMIYFYAETKANTSIGDTFSYNNAVMYKSITDETLTEETIPADAKATGDRITNTTGATPVNWVDGYYIQTNQGIGETVDLTPVAEETYRHAVIDCSEGDTFFLDNLTGGSTPRLYTFIDIDNTILSPWADSSRRAVPLIITAPANATKVIINDHETGFPGTAYIGIPPYYYNQKTRDIETDGINTARAVFGGVSQVNFILGSINKDANDYVANVSRNNMCATDVTKPFPVSAGDTFCIATGYKYIMYGVTIEESGTHLTAFTSGWKTEESTVYESGLYVGLVQRSDEATMIPEEAYNAFHIQHNGLKLKMEAWRKKNPYQNIPWSIVQDVTSVSHAHLHTNTEQYPTRFEEEFANLKSRYDHVAISMYRPSFPVYPLENYFENVGNTLGSPNAEHVHMTGEKAQLHMNAIGSYLSTNTDETSPYIHTGTLENVIAEAVNSMKGNGGGITINHPKWTAAQGASQGKNWTVAQTVAKILSIMSLSERVIAMEVWNASCEKYDLGDSSEIWDGVLSTGNQIYATAVPDHEVQERPQENRLPFGYNHMLVVNRTEDEVLTAYRNGRFYATLYNDGLLLKHMDMSNTGLVSVEVSEASTFLFKTATRSVEVSTAATTATFQTTAGDVYVRVEALRGNNRLWTNAIML